MRTKQILTKIHMFQPNRTIYFAGEVNKETQEQEKKSNAFADAFEANADHKPIDISKKVPGYPDETPEVKDTNSAAYKKAVEVLMAKLKKQLEKQNRDPRHGDVVGETIDGKATFLVYDETTKPKERVFMSKEKTAAAGQETQVTQIPEDVVKSKTKGYPEMKTAPADIVKRAKETFQSQNKREMKHEETATAYDTKDYEYIVLKDESQKSDAKKFRVFKSEKPVPA